jgi:hypothetical protein
MKLQNKSLVTMKISMVRILIFIFHLLSFLRVDSRFSLSPVTPRFRCLLSFIQLEFDLENFDKYDVYFKNSSVMTLAQTGEYQGPDNIKEYVKFVYAGFSPFFLTGPKGPQYKSEEKYIDYNRRTGECIFIINFIGEYSMNPATTSTDGGVLSSAMVKLFYKLSDDYVSRINVYYTIGFLDLLFANFLNSNNTRQYVCDVMKGSNCGSIIETPIDCVNKLADLSAANGALKYVDGYSQGCRALHSVFASTNPIHCPHISFTSMVDLNGYIKCQTSKKMSYNDLFTSEELAAHYTFMSKNGLDPYVGHNYTV